MKSQTFKMSVECNNAAFEPDYEYGRQKELARILRVVADRIELEGFDGFHETILDANGNDVGYYKDDHH